MLDSLGNTTSELGSAGSDDDVSLEDLVLSTMEKQGFLADMKARIMKFVHDNGNVEQGTHVIPSRASKEILQYIFEYLDWVGMRHTSNLLISESPVQIDIDSVNKHDEPPRLCKLFATEEENVSKLSQHEGDVEETANSENMLSDLNQSKDLVLKNGTVDVSLEGSNKSKHLISCDIEVELPPIPTATVTVIRDFIGTLSSGTSDEKLNEDPDKCDKCESLLKVDAADKPAVPDPILKDGDTTVENSLSLSFLEPVKSLVLESLKSLSLIGSENTMDDSVDEDSSTVACVHATPLNLIATNDVLKVEPKLKLNPFIDYDASPEPINNIPLRQPEDLLEAADESDATLSDNKCPSMTKAEETYDSLFPSDVDSAAAPFGSCDYDAQLNATNNPAFVAEDALNSNKSPISHPASINSEDSNKMSNDDDKLSLSDISMSTLGNSTLDETADLDSNSLVSCDQQLPVIL